MCSVCFPFICSSKPIYMYLALLVTYTGTGLRYLAIFLVNKYKEDSLLKQPEDLSSTSV